MSGGFPNGFDGYVPEYPISPMYIAPTGLRSNNRVTQQVNLLPHWPGLPVIHQWPMISPYQYPPFIYDYKSECSRAKRIPIHVPRPERPDYCTINSAMGRPDIVPPRGIADPRIAAVYESKVPFCKLNRLHY